ncbi:MAG: ABC transporter ATP-binding protein, partial [Pseudomonadota bacterium]|nr:ABC transporter ATP-binding protein [Pseudomonadota bacterium]
MTEQIASVTISVQGLCRSFAAHVAVREIDLELKHGEVLGFLGPNGAGKTTIMRMLTGNLAPSAGSIEICGIDLLDKPRDAKARIGYLPEVPPLYRELTVSEYLQFAARLHRISSAKIGFAVDKVIQRCGLNDSGKR